MLLLVFLLQEFLQRLVQLVFHLLERQLQH
jgi:hypothetical protein